jgi:hypothetical protein
MAEYEDLRNKLINGLALANTAGDKPDIALGIFMQYLEELGECKRKLRASEVKLRVTERVLHYHKVRVEQYDAALRKIANGMIDTGFVDTAPPDWHSAFTQLQHIAKEVLVNDKPSQDYQREVLELARGIQIAHAAWLAMGAPGAWDKADG